MDLSKQIIREIRLGKQAALEKLYCQERIPFLSWARKYFGCTPGDAKDLYQMAILITYDNIVVGKLVELRCTFKSYLCAIAKNKWKEWQREKSRVKRVDEYFLIDLVEEKAPFTYSREIIKEMTRALVKLGNPCQKLLESFYYHRMSMDEISKEMAYKNASTTKNLKYKCLGRLKKIVLTSQNAHHHVRQTLHN